MLVYPSTISAQKWRTAACPSGLTATDILLAILGGCFCAAIVLNAREATLALVVVGEASSVALALLFWSEVPHFYNFVHRFVYPPAVLLGAWLVSRVVPKRMS